MLIQSLIGLLTVVGVVVVICLVGLTLAYFGMMYGTTRRMRDTLREFEGRLKELEDRIDLEVQIPPMRIFLETVKRRWHEEDGLCRSVDGWFLSRGFARVGYFQIEELDQEELCIYLSADRRLIGAIRQPKNAMVPYLEFCFEMNDGRRGGVSNPPDTTVGLPIDAVGQHFRGELSCDLRLLERMYTRARELIAESIRNVVPIGSAVEFFEEAHAAEMQCRIISGGISESEIRGSLEQQGVEPTEQDVAQVQHRWQGMIEDYLLEFSPRGKNRYADGCGIMIVHDGSIAGYLVHRIGNWIESDCAAHGLDRGMLIEELRELLDRFSPRDAMARFRPLLPRGYRFELVDQIQQPIEADLYMLPI